MSSSGFVVPTSLSGEVIWSWGARDCCFTQILLHNECVLIATAGTMSLGDCWELEHDMGAGKMTIEKTKVHWELREFSPDTGW